MDPVSPGSMHLYYAIDPLDRPAQRPAIQTLDNDSHDQDWRHVSPGEKAKWPSIRY
jgi:hypothetical protein